MNVEDLWARLGLESLGTATVTETFGADSTLRSPIAAPISRAEGEVRLSLSPPVMGPDEKPPAESEGLSAAADLVVVGRLGQGGMGTVLQARQPSLARDVAVKVPRRREGSHGRSLIEEARLAGSLEHPGIVPVHAIAFDSEGEPALVMRLVDGVSWNTLLSVPDDLLEVRLGRSAPNRLEAHLHVFLQVCNAIAFAHSHGVLHRDLKPANILIGELGEVYVADWGVARRKSAPPGMTGLKGTPAYFAPEMCTGDDGQMDERTDVFLLGATLYEVITGSPPYARAAGVREAVAAAWMGVIPPVPPHTPEELEKVVLKAMAHEKAERFQTVLELRNAVAAYLRHAASHRLAAAAQGNLQRLADATQRLATRDEVAPLASASRFGFMHSLTEWADNAEAKAGLEKTLELCARYEVRNKNAAAARALLHEMKSPSDTLRAEVEQLEEAQAETSQVVKEFARARRELDPQVAMMQRVAVFLAMAVAVSIATLGPALIPAWESAEAGLGRWGLLSRLLPALAAFGAVTLLFRRDLLGTRLNRRFVGTLAASLVGLVANRTVCALMGVAPPQTLLIDMVVLGTAGMCEGVLLHTGFFSKTAVGAVAVSLALMFPGHERTFFMVAVILALLTTLVTWTRWRSELTDRPTRRARAEARR